jgi:hypothetical protein
MDEGAMEFSMEELREFLEGDLVEVRADPEFKERLRQKLWEMLRGRAIARRGGGDRGAS